MIKKLIRFIVIVAFFVLFGPRLIILSFGIWDYFHTDVSCQDIETSRVSLDSLLPPTMIVFEVKPFAVLTDRGYMYPGDEYDAYGEGIWYGMDTLLSVGSKGATFLIDYSVYDPVNGYSRQKCRSFIPIGDH